MFLQLGFLRPYKGTLELITAFRQLQKPELRLLIVGKPVDSDYEHRLFNAISDANNIQLIPEFVDDGAVAGYAAASDVMVYPFKDILSSGSVVMGMTLGRTGVAVAAGCVLDILDNDIAYLYSQPDDLLGALQAAISDSENTLDKGAKCRERALHWSWDSVGRATYQLYLQAQDQRTV